MIGAGFVKLYNKYKLNSFIGVDDWADRLSYVYSYAILLGCTIVVTSETYLFKPIACHMPTAPEGKGFKKYVESACWVLGTIPIRPNESMPQRQSEWKDFSEERRITYYQWVPFVLGLQCIMFYLPRLAWQCVSFNRLGTDLNALLNKASEALVAKSDPKRDECIRQVAHALEMLLFAHRDYRHGMLEDIRQKLFTRFGCLFVSKRLGTWIVFSYFCIKLAYLANTIVQLYLMHLLLGYDQSLFAFSLKLFRCLSSDTDWPETLYFPRLAYCPIRLSHFGSRNNVYTGVCALPVNMLNEKIYMFLYFWVSIVMSVTLASIPVWLFRIGTQGRRTGIIYKYLQIKPPPIDSTESNQSDRGALDLTSELKHRNVDPTKRKNVEMFVANFLRLDGVFLISVLTANAGDVVTADIVGLLWRAWVDRYAGRLDWEDPGDESDSSSEPEYETPYVPTAYASSLDSGVYGLNQGSGKLILNGRTDL